jgi:PAS domain S-box-containing protein
VTALALLAAALVWSRWESRRATEALENARLGVQARAVEQTLARQLIGVHAALRGLQRGLADWPEGDRVARAALQLQALCEAVPGLHAMQWLDADGRVRAGNRASLPGRDDAAQPYFMGVRRHPDPAVLYVSAPFVASDGIYTLNLSLAVLDAEEHFAGVLAATLSPAYLRSVLDSVSYAADMRVAVVHGYGTALVVNPDDPQVQGLNVARPGSPFSQHLASGAVATVLTGHALGAPDRRQIALRTLRPEGLPMDAGLVISVSRDRDAVFAPWLRQTEWVSALFMGFAVAAGLALLASQRQRLSKALMDAERQLQAATEAERLALALHGGDLALWDAHLPSGHGSVNARWCEMVGYQPGEVDTDEAGWAALVHPDDLARVRALQADHVEGRCASYEAQYRLRHRDGSWVWVLDRGRVVERDATGVPTRMVGTHMDITARVAVEEALHSTEARLREAQKMESIGTLAGGIAHDFNNILAAILGNLALARADLPAEHRASVSLDQIQKSSLRARSLVQQILTFSRRQLNPLVSQALRPVIDETLGLLRATLPAAVRLDTRLSEEALWVEADATQLQQVLMNLCTNAWHALPEGRGRIEVGCATLQDNSPLRRRAVDLQSGPCAHLWVSDDGTGMDRATLDRIFDPFFTTKPVGQGTGLGLSVVHGIVRAHQGAVVVDSAPAEGSTFHLLLPLVPEPQAVSAGPAQAASPGAPGRASRRVLYVDDDEVMLLMVERLLEREGYCVLTSSDAVQALAGLHDGTLVCELVISDFNMPELSGIELAQQLQAQPRLQGLPVIITSGFVTEELREQAASLGVRALLKKERTLEELAGLVRQVLGDESALAPAAAPAADLA